jgi:hypothetical protein
VTDVGEAGLQLGEDITLGAPARLRIAANMCGFACGYAAVCLQRPLWFAYGATSAGCGVRLIVQP